MHYHRANQHIMGHMKYLHQLMESRRIEDLNTACKEAVDNNQDMFIFDGAYMSTKYAQNLINYASKNPLRIDDEDN